MNEALEQFAEYRKKEIELLDGADDILWKKTGIHPEYDLYLQDWDVVTSKNFLIFFFSKPCFPLLFAYRLSGFVIVVQTDHFPLDNI